jgi:hypothetical protein
MLYVNTILPPVWLSRAELNVATCPLSRPTALFTLVKSLLLLKATWVAVAPPNVLQAVCSSDVRTKIELSLASL